MQSQALNTSPSQSQKTFPPDWSGYKVVCIASGPSLTKADVDRVKAWRFSGENRAVIVTNTTHTIAPWADVLYAMDSKWWQRSKTGQAEFQGLKITGKRRTTDNCPIATRVDFDQGGNSGAGAMMLAKHWGASRIILLGYDCQYAPNGKRHWHGDHPVGLGNCVSLPKFPQQFTEIAEKLGSVDVVNASRATALDQWRRVNIDHALSV